tara:strand:+ start:10805 stop:12718 length:1914 start_codon:yes stop_codon:yes gene_type:complete
MATKQVNIDIIAKDKSKQALNKFQNNLDKVKKSAFNLKTALIGIGSAVALRSILSTTAEFEDLRDSLESVTGSAQAGKEAFKFISDFATRTQFSVQDLSRSFITLKASGIEPTEKLLQTFTDTAAVTTDQLGVLEAMTRVFSRGVQGGLGLEELNQIADRGIPVFKILEKEIGVTRLELSKFGQTTEGASKILNALQKGLSETFAGATEKKLDNLSVAFSNLKIALANTSDSFGQEVSPEVVRFTDNLKGMIEFLEPAIQALGFLSSKILAGLNFMMELTGKGVDSLQEKLISWGLISADVSNEQKNLARETQKGTDVITTQNKVIKKTIDLTKQMSKFDLHKKMREQIQANKILLDDIKNSNLTELELLDQKHKKELELINEQKELLKNQAEIKILEGSDFELEAKMLKTHLLELNELEKTVRQEGAKERLALVERTAKEEQEIRKRFFDKNLDAIKNKQFHELELEKLTKSEVLDLTKATGREVLSELSQNNKTIFALNKALALSDAVISTARGVSKALALGPFGIPLAVGIGALGAAQIATIASTKYQGRRLGGRINQGQPFLVGEAGPELVVPDKPSNVIPNHQLGNSQPVTVNFNISTVDARGFNELLLNSRGAIVNIINSAVNEKGRMAIV